MIQVDPFGNYLCQKLVEVSPPENLGLLIGKVCLPCKLCFDGNCIVSIRLLGPGAIRIQGSAQFPISTKILNLCFLESITLDVYGIRVSRDLLRRRTNLASPLRMIQSSYCWWAAMQRYHILLSRVRRGSAYLPASGLA